MEKNSPILSEKEISLFDSVIKDLNTAVKNSVLYTTEHSICVYSIKNLKNTLDKWLEQKETLSIGISQDSLFCDNLSMESKHELYKEIAGYMHLRGIVSLTFTGGITEGELTSFFELVRKDSRAIREAGGLSQQLPDTDHLRIKEIDYSELLFSAKEEVDSEEKEIWQKLFNIAEELKGGDIPESKMEFLRDFLKDSGTASRTLNRLYHDAMEKLDTGPVVEEMRGTIAKICAHFEKQPFAEKQEIKVDIMQILSKLSPDLVSQLFEKTQVQGEEFDLAESVTKGFSDSFIADFIESLISNEESFNENMLKVFDKLAPDENKANSIVSMVADKLLGKRILNPETLSQLQISIKDIFASHPNSNFMSQMYKITVDAVTNRKIDTLVYVARLSPLINKFVQSVDENRLKKEEVWLLLNILWLEEDAGEFKKLGLKLIDVMPELFDSRDIGLIGEITEFFAENLRPEQTQNQDMNSSIKEIIAKISSRDNLQNIVAMIPEAKSDSLEEIAVILARAVADFDTKIAGFLLDAFIAEKNPARKNKYRAVLVRLKESVVSEVMDRMDYSEPEVIRELYHILKEYAPEKAHIIAVRLISHQNPQVRWVGLDGFVPVNEEEKNSLFSMFKKEKTPEIQKKAAEVLLSMRDSIIIEKMFSMTMRGGLLYKKLFMIVEICGQIRLAEAFPYLKKIFKKKAVFFKKRNDELRMAVVTSLGRIHTEESMYLIREGSSDRREKVRKMCEILLKLDERA